MEDTIRPKPNESILLAEEQVQFILDEQPVLAPGRVLERLWPSPWVIIEVSGVEREPKPIAPGSTSDNFKRFPPTSQGPSSVQFESGGCVKVVSVPQICWQSNIVLPLKTMPTVAFSSGKPIAVLEFSVLNITEDIFCWPLALHAPPWIVTIEPVPELRGVEKTLRTNGGYAVTHQGKIEQSDRRGFSEEAAQDLLRGLDHFLSFVCGSRCATTNVVGLDCIGNKAWERWGSCGVSSWKPRLSWVDITLKDEVSQMLGKFWHRYSKNAEHLDRVLGWYVSSNEAEGNDLSIALNQIVLELLLSLVSSEIKSHGKIGDRFASMLRKQGIPVEIPCHYRDLIAFANEHNLEHGPHTIVKIRNSIVHAESKVEINSLNTLYQAKQLGLWYIELLLLKMFKYSAEYASRLNDVQRAGATEPLPWT